MKISASNPVLDLAAPAPTASADSAAAGEGFETAVRAVADKAGQPPRQPERAPDAHRKADVTKKPDAASQASTSKDEEDAPADDASSSDAATSAANTPTADLLGRLLASAGLAASGQAAPAKTGGPGEAANDTFEKLTGLSDADAAALAAVASAAEDGTTFDGALQERLVITPLGAGAAEGKAQGAAKDRTGVGLEVLHMETHFEPRVDDVVLVEGAAAKTPAAAGEAADDVLGGVLSTIRAATGKVAEASERAAPRDANGLSTRFDETLARLGSGENVGDRGADASDQRGMKDRRQDAKVSDEGRQSIARARTETVIEVESAVATPGPGSMTSQIADRIVDAFRPSNGEARLADPAPGTTHLRMTAGGAALKTLTIQLQPENLGKLEVTMRLVEGRLTLELAASSAETATALAHDRAGLKKLLEHAGFSLDEAAISIIARDSTAAMTKSGSASDASGQGQQQASSGNGRNGADGASSGGERGFARESGSQDRDPEARRRMSVDAEPQTKAGARSSVFL